MFSVPMAIVDYIPVCCYMVAALILQRDLYNKMSKGAFALFSAGTIFVFAAGFLKATYKLLYAAGICNFEALNKMFFPTQSMAFVLAGVGLVAMLIFNQGEGKSYSVVPPLYTGTFIFVSMMVVGLGMMDACLAIIAKKMKCNKVMILFAVSFVFSLMMGYLSSKDFTQSYMNWAAEVVNSIAQISLLSGVIVLHKNGLKDAQL